MTSSGPALPSAGLEPTAVESIRWPLRMLWALPLQRPVRRPPFHWFATLGMSGFIPRWERTITAPSRHRPTWWCGRKTATPVERLPDPLQTTWQGSTEQSIAVYVSISAGEFGGTRGTEPKGSRSPPAAVTRGNPGADPGPGLQFARSEFQHQRQTGHDSPR